MTPRIRPDAERGGHPQVPRRTLAPRATLVCLSALLALAVAAGAQAAEAPQSGSGATPGAAAGDMPRLVVGATTTPQLCADVLRRLTGVTRPLRNVVHADYAPFVISKPQIEPLETQQYLQYEDEARTRPAMLMCKGKSADHVVAIYGPGAARTDLATTCRDVNRDIVLGVWNSLGLAERAAARVTPQRIMLDADDVKLTGSRWITAHQFAWTGADGLPHLQARRLRADWTDWRWRLAPQSWRGTYYCQLASPEYVHRLLLGQVVPGPRASAD
ncbi:MAG: hypothetical protein U1F18_03195 [Steroidobacteraceae bacterium]